MPNLRLTSTLHYTLHKLCALALCCALALVSACAQVYGKNYFPLTDGAKWEYTGRLTSAAGRQSNINSQFHIDGETLIHGQRYFKYVVTADFSGIPGGPKSHEEVRYYRVAPDGIYFLSGRDIDQPELLEMPLPIPIGMKWLSGTTEVQAEHAGTIKLGDREYKDCLKVTYRLADGVRSTVNYLAPDVGIVKVVYENITAPKSTIELVLEKFNL
jgi:hypothetical protein